MLTYEKDKNISWLKNTFDNEHVNRSIEVMEKVNNFMKKHKINITGTTSGYRATGNGSSSDYYISFEITIPSYISRIDLPTKGSGVRVDFKNFRGVKYFSSIDKMLNYFITTHFRPHKPSIIEALKYEVGVQSFDDLYNHLKNEFTDYYGTFTKGDILIKKYGIGIDERCGYNTHIVLVKGNPAGFTDRNIINHT